MSPCRHLESLPSNEMKEAKSTFTCSRSSYVLMAGRTAGQITTDERTKVLSRSMVSDGRKGGTGEGNNAYFTSYSTSSYMFTCLLLLCFFFGVGAEAEDCALARQRFNSTFEALLAGAPVLRETVLRLEPFATLFPNCVDAPSCTDLWTNVRDGVPAACDATCWADVERTFLRKHGECAGVVEASCVSRLRAQKDCNESCRSTFIESHADCRNMFEGTCDDKHETYDAKYATFSSPSVRGRREPFLAVFPECAECTMKRSMAEILFSDRTKNMNTFPTNLSKYFPGCDVKRPLGLPLTLPLSTAVSGVRRRLIQRYDLCNIASSGHYEISENCSITKTITINEGNVLAITGILERDGARPAIDGGWNGVPNSNTGIQLFNIRPGGTLMIDNMILTHGEVRFS